MTWKQAILYIFIGIFILALIATQSGQTDGKILSYTSTDDTVCLAKNIYWEARNESTAGRLAVAWTVINRVRSERFPDSICGVVEQGIKYANGFPKRDKCQFSWYCDGIPDIVTNISVWRNAYRLAEYVSVGRDHLVDITDGSLWYHADYVFPRWAKHKKRTAKIDTHIFYR